MEEPNDRDSNPDPFHEVEVLIADGDLLRARRALLSLHPDSAGEPARRAELLERLEARERILGPATAFESARERGDWIEARRHARRALACASGDDAAAFARASDECAARIRAEWRIWEAEIDEPLARAPEAIGWTPYPDGAPATLLSSDGRTVVLVASHERWIFLREIDVETQRCRWVGWLRSPVELGSLGTVQIVDNAAFLSMSGGLLLEVSRHPLDIERSVSLRPFMLPDRIVEDSLVVPPGRYVWGELKELDEEGRIAVIDAERMEVCARPGVDHFDPVPGSSPPQVVGYRTLEHTAELFDAAGVRMGWRTPESGRLRAIVAHPRGSGWIALVTVDDEASEEGSVPLGLVEMIEGRAPSEPLVIDGSDEDAPACLGLSREARLVFVATPARQGTLFAYRVGLRGLEQVWAVAAPGRTALVQDPSARHSIAVAPGFEGLALARLGRSPPPLPSGRELPPLQIFAPTSREYFDRPTDDLSLDQQIFGLAPAALGRWVERSLKERRRDPAALAALAQALGRCWRLEEADRVLTAAETRHPGHPHLGLVRASLLGNRGDWLGVERLLALVDAARLSEPQASHRRYLLGLARLEAGDPESAIEHLAEVPSAFEEAAAPKRAVAQSLLAGPGAEATSAPAQIVRACLRADDSTQRDDLRGARDALDIPAVHASLELQSAARLAEAHLTHEGQDAAARFKAAIDLARLVGAHPRQTITLPGLGWDAARIAAVRARASARLEELERRDPVPVRPISDGSRPTEAEAAEVDRTSHPAGEAEAHSLPPLAHETMRALVPDLERAILETVRYVRELPGWDETQTLSDDVGDLAPARRFLKSFADGLEARGAEPEVIERELERLRHHLAYRANFELHRRKLFHTDAALAWMLHRTSVDVEGGALRLPFPAFGFIFADGPTLDLAARILSEGGALAPGAVKVVTVYVVRRPAPEAAYAFRLYFLFDRQDGRWPELRYSTLRFAEDDDLERISASSSRDPSTRSLTHLVVNAILYANSAGVAWPIARSPLRRLKAKANAVGDAKRARLEHRAAELGRQYSAEDVFLLPGKIPISTLRRFEETEKHPEGRELMSRFMVRGHWRRAGRAWKDQRLRWIEPYWKGPDLAAVIEREYKLEI